MCEKTKFSLIFLVCALMQHHSGNLVQSSHPPNKLSQVIIVIVDDCSKLQRIPPTYSTYHDLRLLRILHTYTFGVVFPKQQESSFHKILWLWWPIDPATARLRRRPADVSPAFASSVRGEIVQYQNIFQITSNIRECQHVSCE